MKFPSHAVELIIDVKLWQGSSETSHRTSLSASPVSAVAVKWDELHLVCNKQTFAVAAVAAALSHRAWRVVRAGRNLARKVVLSAAPDSSKGTTRKALCMVGKVHAR